MSNYPKVGNVMPLQKRTSWERYKNNYDQSEIEYSKWGRIESSTVLYSKAKEQYLLQAQKAKSDYYAKFSGVSPDRLDKGKLAELDFLNNIFEKDIFSKAAIKAMKEITADKQAFSKIVYKALSDMNESKSTGDAALMQKARADMQEAANTLRRLLDTSIPESLGMQIGENGADFYDVGERLYGATMDSGALTSYLNSVRILEALEKTVDNPYGATVDSTGSLIFQKYARSSKEELNKMLSSKSAFSEQSIAQAYKDTDISVLVQKSQTIGSTIGRASGLAFEGGIGRAIQDVTSAMGIDIINAVQAAGADRGSTGKQEKPDYKVSINGKNIDLSKIGGAPVNEFTVPLAQVDANLSIKQDKIAKGSIYDNSSFGVLFNEIADGSSLYHQSVLYHYYQLYSVVPNGSKGKDKEQISALNAYVTSHLIMRALGKEIDYLVFSNGSISKFNYIQKLAKDNKKMLRLLPKFSTINEMDIATDSAQIRNN